MATPNPQYWTEDDLLDNPSYGSGVGTDASSLQANASTSTPSPDTDTFFDTPSYDKTPAVQPTSQTQPLSQPQAAAASTSTPSTSGANYNGLLSQIQAAADPNQKIVLQDQLARQVYNDLKAAGHDVKWQGDQLMVDGRAYVLGDGTNVSDPLMDTSKSPGAGWTLVGGQWTNPNTYVNGQQVGKANGPVTSSSTQPSIRATLDAVYAQYGRGTPTEADYENWEHYAQQYGWAPDDAYMIMRMGYEARGEDYEAQFQQPGLTPSYGVDAPGAAGVTTTVSTPAPPPPPSWSPTAPTYTPGEIDTLDDFDPLAGSGDLSDATKQAILDMLSGTSGGEVDRETEQAILNLLKNPSSLDDRTVEMMKAKSREEQDAMAAQDDEAMREAGFAGGFDDSRWLASERLANRRTRDDAIIGSNRDLDIQAANQRASDQRSAIELGASYANQKATQQQQAVAASQSFLALQSDNAFKTAALQGDRLALKESVAQKAAELGQSADQLLLNYTLGVMQDLTQRYGIDVGASIDRAKLQQAGEEFQLNLALQYAQLAQSDAQFGASYALDSARFSADEDQRAINNQRTDAGF